MTVNLRQLQYLVTIADDGSFTSAARRLYVSQPSLSQQIRALEAEIGGELLERLPRGIRLTPAGHAFVESARVALLASERATSAARAVLGLEGGELDIGTVSSISFALLPALARDWNEHFPDVALRVRECPRRGALEEAVRSGNVELGIGARPATWAGPVETLASQEVVAVVPPGDALERFDRVPLAALAHRRMVLLEPEHEFAEFTSQLFAAAGFEPRAAFHTANEVSAPLLAATGLGPTLVPAAIVPPELAPSTLRLDPPAARDVCLFARRDWSPAAAHLRTVARRCFTADEPREALVA